MVKFILVAISMLMFGFLLDETIEMLEKRVADSMAVEDRTSYLDSYEKVPNPKSVTYTDYENPFSLVDQSSGAPHIARLSSNAWVGCGNDIYVLECLGKGYIRIEPIEETAGMHDSHTQSASALSQLRSR
jgi:ATP-dependent helicase IRC3